MEDYDILSDHSGNGEAYYSDQIDSDIEAELYSLVHHDTQENSMLCQDKSDSVKSKSLLNKPCSRQNNSVLQQNQLNPTAHNSKTILTDSISPEIILDSVKKLKNSAKKSALIYSASLKTSPSKIFSSDTIKNNNLYTSFESPLRKQRNQVQSESSKKHLVNKPAKRKSEVVSEILGNIQLKKTSVIQKNSISINKKHNPDQNSRIDEENSFVEVIDETSDSDSDSSILFLEPNQSNLQTNIEKETVDLSSDAEDSDSSMEKSLSRVCQRKPETISNTNSNSDNKDPWQINSDDRFRTKKQSNRYHENAFVTCTKCQLKGHSAKFCSLPKTMKCFFCGDYHSGMDCKNKICTKCFQIGHDRRRCYMRYINNCELCCMKGHSIRTCPDLWRRYHLTTLKGAIVKGNPNPHSPLYCYNCGSKGHFGAECLEIRTDRWSFCTWPSVISYKNPIAALQRERKERNIIDRTPVFQKKKQNEMIPNDTPTHTERPKKKKKKKKPPQNQKNPAYIENKKNSPQGQKNPRYKKFLPRLKQNNVVQNEVYFPRTPKATTNSSNPRGCKRRKIRYFKQKEVISLTPQMKHRVGLHERLGLPFPSTV